jgi:hypothetical protein
MSASPDGTVTFSGSSAIVGGTTTFGIEKAGARPGGVLAFVFLPTATVTLSGTAVTGRSAAAIARALRPL